MSEEVKSESEKKKEDWMNSKWRPMMGWLYMATCTFDFVIFPILWSLLQAITKAGPITQWQPLTLQGAGLYHIAMGAVLGLAAFGRTQEKLAGANNGGIQAPTTGFASGPSTFSQPTAGFGAPAGGFGASAAAPTGFGGGSGFGTTAAVPTAGGFGGGFSSPAPIGTTMTGKKIVPDADQPLL
jgi:hypothetical protein